MKYRVQSEGEGYNLKEKGTICQSKQHEKINDLRERGYRTWMSILPKKMPYKVPCCNEIFYCCHCYNETKDDIGLFRSLRHDITTSSN
nr:E3 ubiquitin-protein ligase RZFP34-like [Arachis hypogaea]